MYAHGMHAPLHTTHRSIFHSIKFSVSDICTYFTNTLQGLW